MEGNRKATADQKVAKVFEFAQADMLKAIGRAMEIGQLDASFIGGLVDFVVQQITKTDSDPLKREQIVELRTKVEARFRAIVEDLAKDNSPMRQRMFDSLGEYDLGIILNNTVLEGIDLGNGKQAFDVFIQSQGIGHKTALVDLASAKLELAWLQYQAGKRGGIVTRAQLRKAQQEVRASQGVLRGSSRKLMKNHRVSPVLKGQSKVKV